MFSDHFAILADVKIFFLNNILMYFGMKNTLKNNHYPF